MVIGEAFRCVITRIADQFTSKVFVLSDSVLCLGGKCQEHPEAAIIWENDRIRDFVPSPEYRP